MVHFSNFSTIHHSSGKSGFVTINFISENFEKKSDKKGRKYPDRKKDRLDIYTLFYTTVPATAKLLPRSKKIIEQMILNTSN